MSDRAVDDAMGSKSDTHVRSSDQKSECSPPALSSGLHIHLPKQQRRPWGGCHISPRTARTPPAGGCGGKSQTPASWGLGPVGTEDLASKSTTEGRSQVDVAPRGREPGRGIGCSWGCSPALQLLPRQQAHCTIQHSSTPKVSPELLGFPAQKPSSCCLKQKGSH